LFEGANSTKVPLSDGTEKGHGISEKEEPEATASLSFPNIDRWICNLSCWQSACD